MFQDTNEGQTHSYGDGCGSEEHNPWWKEYIDRIDGDTIHLCSTIEALIAEAKRLERERIVRIVEKHMEENKGHMCKATSCSDPICGHSRCIDWMYTDLLKELSNEQL